MRWQLIAYVFVSVVLWMVAAQLGQRRTGVLWVRRLSQGWVASILRFVYYVGLPYAALILGVVPGRYLGLVGYQDDALLRGVEAVPGAWQLFSQIRDIISLAVLDWLPDVGTMAGLAVVMLLLLGFTWLGYGRFKRGVTPGPGFDPSPPRREDTPLAIRVAYQAIHWSFYRSAVWLLTDDLYLGVIGGILLVGGEWVLDPGWTARVRRAPSAEDHLIDASLLIATSVMFFFVPNLWLLAPAHWLLAVASRWWVALGQSRMPGSQYTDRNVTT